MLFFSNADLTLLRGAALLVKEEGTSLLGTRGTKTACGFFTVGERAWPSDGARFPRIDYSRALSCERQGGFGVKGPFSSESIGRVALPKTWVTWWSFEVHPLTRTAGSCESYGVSLKAASLLREVLLRDLGLAKGGAHFSMLPFGRVSSTGSAGEALVACSALKGVLANLTKDQAFMGYTPYSDNVGDIRRLRVTKGIALPTDTPIHGIFGSKDVIHSWAIPGLGLKIDCIPGFNSHRRVYLQARGLY